MAASAPAPRKRRTKVDYFKWATGIAVPLLVAAIPLLKKGDEKKTPNSYYIGSMSIIGNQYQLINGQPLKDDTKTQLVSAFALADHGEFEESRKIMEQVAEVAPVPAVLNAIGAFYAEKGDTAKAREFFDKALTKDGSYKPAADNLARLKSSAVSTGSSEKAIAGGRESEPNNDILHATILPVGTTVAGDIADPSDTDFFRFTTGHAPRDIYRITMTPALTLRPDIFVYDPQRNQMFEDSRPTAGAILEKDFSPAPDANYYVQIGSYNNSGAYTLTVKPLHRYDSFEPNNDITSAKPIPLGKAIEANIMDQSDTDFYQVKSGSAPSLTVTMNPSVTLRPDIFVYDTQRNQMFEDSRPTAGALLERKFDVQPNSVYYIQIGSYNNSGPYSLTVK